MRDNIRIKKEIDRARGAHPLKTMERNNSDHGEKTSDNARLEVLTLWRERRGQVRTKKATEQRVLTP